MLYVVKYNHKEAYLLLTVMIELKYLKMFHFNILI